MEIQFKSGDISKETERFVRMKGHRFQYYMEDMRRPNRLNISDHRRRKDDPPPLSTIDILCNRLMEIIEAYRMRSLPPLASRVRMARLLIWTAIKRVWDRLNGSTTLEHHRRLCMMETEIVRDRQRFEKRTTYDSHEIKRLDLLVQQLREIAATNKAKHEALTRDVHRIAEAMFKRKSRRKLRSRK